MDDCVRASVGTASEAGSRSAVEEEERRRRGVRQYQCRDKVSEWVDVVWG